ncbi:MAG: hypothetical protein AAF384_12385 [Pseudomonadota bacterium]
MIPNRKLPQLLLLILLGASGSAAGKHFDARSWADIIEQALAAAAPLPVISAHDAGFDLARAYQLQEVLVQRALQHSAIGGFKAGFTNPASRERFALKTPVFGVMFTSGKLTGEPTLKSEKYPILVEMEIGFQLRSPIVRRMRSVDDLRTYVRHAVPVIELPELPYPDLGAIKGIDIVGSNMAAKSFLVGAPLALDDIDEMHVEMRFDDEVIDQGNTASVMGHPLAALLWLVNELHDRGYAPQPGQTLLTGAIGKINPGKPGNYMVRYGDAQVLRFTIEK